VPESLVHQILSLNHDSIYTAHPGRHCILDILNLKFWCKRMSKHVDWYVSKYDFKAPMGKVQEPTRHGKSSVWMLLVHYGGPKRVINMCLGSWTAFRNMRERYPSRIFRLLRARREYATQIITRHGVNNVLVTNNGRSFTATFLMKCIRFWVSSIIRSETGHTNEYIGR
jgi:hypothetical protein